MKVYYPKLYNMTHLSLNVFTASKGSNNYILFIGITFLIAPFPDLCLLVPCFRPNDQAIQTANILIT